MTCPSCGSFLPFCRALEIETPAELALDCGSADPIAESDELGEAGA